MATPQTERIEPSFKPQQLSFPLPKALHTTAHVHLTVLDKCTTVFISTSTPGDSAGSVKPLGSFVYAMPDVSRRQAQTGINIAMFLYPTQCSILCHMLPEPQFCTNNLSATIISWPFWHDCIDCHLLIILPPYHQPEITMLTDPAKIRKRNYLDYHLHITIKHRVHYSSSQDSSTSNRQAHLCRLQYRPPRSWIDGRGGDGGSEGDCQYYCRKICLAKISSSH